MTNYARYKKWWIEHQAPNEPPPLHYRDTPETQFEEHINKMSLFELMETLEVWEEVPVPVQDEPSLTKLLKLLNDAVEKFKEQNNPPPFVSPRPPYTYNPPPLTTDNVKPQCRKCGMRLDQVMGFVCGDNNCPTFMKVTC